MIRFGAPVFTDPIKKTGGAGESHGSSATDPVALARAVKKKGYRAAYAPQVDVNDRAAVRAVRDAFAEEDIMIAEVGYWQNLVDTDTAARDRNRDTMTDALRLADELGAQCAVNIFGSYCRGNGNSRHVGMNFSDDAFDEAVSMARSFIDAVRPRRASFCYEMFPFDITDSPENIERLIEAVDRPLFGVHLDLVNLINCPRAYFRSGDIIRDCVRRFGGRIVSAHAKDIRMKEPSISVILEEVMAGTGGLDIAAYLHALSELPHDVPLMLEHLASEAEYDTAAAHYRSVAMQEGISL
ncbi:MAG: sugar phosphate isomerase/epimerase [Spirochaetota bacterium]